MQCHKFIKYQDDYLDGLLNGDIRDEVDSHLENCPECAKIIRLNRQLLCDLRALDSPAVSPGFLKLAIKNAVAQKRERQQKTWWFQFAATAALLCLIILGSMNYAPWPATNTGQQTNITLSLHESKEVSLLVQSPKALDNATITIELPPQLMLVNNPGMRQFSWQADFKKGRNLIPLPLVATGGGNVQVIAKIEYQNQVKVMQMDVQIIAPAV